MVNDKLEEEEDNTFEVNVNKTIACDNILAISQMDAQFKMNTEFSTCIKCGIEKHRSQYRVIHNKKGGLFKLGEYDSTVIVCENCLKIIIKRKRLKRKFNNNDMPIGELAGSTENLEAVQFFTNKPDKPKSTKSEFSIKVHLPNINNIENYINKCLTSNFEKLQFNWKIECMDSNDEFDTFQALLCHIEDCHFGAAGFECSFADCVEKFSAVQSLASHIVLRHCPFLNNLQIYGICIHCNFAFSNYLSFNQHSCYRTVKRSAGMKLHCKICNLYFISFKRYQFHMQFHEVAQRPMGCLICKEIFENVEQCFEHVMYDHDEEATLTCRICDRIFFQQEKFDIHMNTHDPTEKFKCDICKAKFMHPSQLRNHKEIIHMEKSKNKIYTCDKCDKTFLTPLVLLQHSKTHAIENEILVAVCSKCGQIGITEDDLKTHIENPTSTCFAADIDRELLKVVYTCEYCSLDFKNKISLQSHRTTDIHRNADFICVFCKKEFSDFKALSVHSYIHNSVKASLDTLPLDRMYLCNFDNCSEAYRNWNILQQHKRRTHREKSCIGCKMTFNGQEALVLHQDTCKELPERTGQCQFCEKIFDSKMSLKVHIARRHNNKNFTCEICDACIKSEDALQKHMDTMHIPVTCDICERGFKNKRSYEAHSKKFHASS